MRVYVRVCDCLSENNCVCVGVLVRGCLCVYVLLLLCVCVCVSKETVVMSEVCFFLAFYLCFKKSSHSHSLRAILDLPTQQHVLCGNFVSLHRFPSKFQR